MLQCQVRTLSVFGYGPTATVSLLIMLIEQGDIRRTTKPMLPPRTMGRRIDEAGLANTCSGSVMDGIKVVMALDGWM